MEWWKEPFFQVARCRLRSPLASLSGTRLAHYDSRDSLGNALTIFETASNKRLEAIEKRLDKLGTQSRSDPRTQLALTGFLLID